jgi:ribosomal protein S18 acetylase RimI-like enzyme
MDLPLAIDLYTGNYDDLLFLLHMSIGIESAEGVKHLLAIELARGTRYYTAKIEGRIVGLIGVWFDPTGRITELEPPQIIDIAVSPEYRCQGVARALMERAVAEVRAAGLSILWLYTDGNNSGLLTFYRKMGFQLAAVVPDWFGKGSVKAYFRLNLE